MLPLLAVSTLVSFLVTILVIVVVIFVIKLLLDQLSLPRQVGVIIWLILAIIVIAYLLKRYGGVAL